ncbi:MAG: YkgJ family cysteine cluster protein [Candidatus Micrarchaeota archaeon]
MVNPCIFCKSECCRTYTITISVFDLARIIKKTKTTPESYVTLLEPRLLSYDPDCVFDTKEGYFLLGLKSHPCYFLNTKNHKCRIHKTTPLSCRRYPYNVVGKLNTRFCPLTSQLLFRINGPDMDSNQLIKELEEHKKLVKKWNKKPGTKKHLLKFLLKAVQE